MTIDGTNISTFGLIVQRVTGYNNLPALKKILTERTFDSNDITINENKIVIKMFGSYASNSLMESGINGLKSLLELDVEHDVVLVSRGISFTGVANRGFKASIFRFDASLTLEFGVVV